MTCSPGGASMRTTPSGGSRLPATAMKTSNSRRLRRGPRRSVLPGVELGGVEVLELEARALGERDAADFRPPQRHLTFHRLHEPVLGPVGPAPRLAVAQLDVEERQVIVGDVER